MQKSLGPKILLVGIVWGWMACAFVACIGAPPLRTYTVARTALESARKVEASRKAPDEMLAAEENFRKGEVYFRGRDYPEALNAFELTIRAAEVAENKARLPIKQGQTENKE